jgi:hypothetical protein
MLNDDIVNVDIQIKMLFNDLISVWETGGVDVIHEVVGKTPQVEEAVQQDVEDNPNISIRGIGRNLTVNYSVVQRILKSEAF